MKKAFRILAVVLAATMLMCCCAMATSGSASYRGGTVYYSCSCGPTSSSASTEYSIAGPDRSVDLDVEWEYRADYYYDSGTTGDSMTNISGTAYASCSYYATAAKAESTHEVSPTYYKHLTVKYNWD